MKVEYCASAIRALINAGADKTIRDNNDETALDIAFAQGVPNIVHELLRVKACFHFRCFVRAGGFLAPPYAKHNCHEPLST